MKVRLLKNLTSDGVELQTGEVVDASNWKNTRALINSRFVEIVEEEAKAIIPTAVKPKIKKTASKA
jgi:hypothetical protein